MRRIGFGLTGDVSVRDAIMFVKEAEASGYESFWMHETYFHRDAFSFLMAVAVMTEHILLATGCISSYTRHPIQMALSLATLDETSKGRAILGLGTGSITRLDQMGIEHSSPLTNIRETVAVCRHLWSGEEIDYRGSGFHIQGIKSAFKPYRTNLPIYLGASGPSMLKLAVHEFDGYLAPPGKSLQSLKELIKVLNEQISATERLIQLDIAAYILTLVADDRKLAYELAKHNQFLLYLIAILNESEIEANHLDEKKVAAIAQAYWRNEIQIASNLVSNEMVELFAVVGNEQDVITKLQIIADLGVKIPILQPLYLNRTAVQQVILVGARYANLVSRSNV